MMDLTTLKLNAGEGLLLTDLNDAGPWRLDSSDEHLWLTSPPLNDGATTGSQRLNGLFACLSEHLQPSSPAGLRLMADSGGAVYLQLCLPQGQERGSPAPAAQAMWAEMRQAWQAWRDVLLTGEAPERAPRGASTHAASARSSFAQLAAVVQAEAEFAGRVQVLVDEGALAIEPEHETWAAVVRMSPGGQELEVLLPVLQFPQDEQGAIDAALHALSFNAGPLLGPDLMLALDAPDLEDALLLLRKTMPAGHVNTEDIKAAIGQLLLAASELRSAWPLSTGPETATGAATELASAQGLQDRFYTNLRG